MAKEFKQFDRLYRKEGLALAMSLRSRMKTYMDGDVVSWVNEASKSPFPHDVIRNLVYFCEDASEWQIFRVALKSFNTHEKLALLKSRYESGSEDDKIRISNYIGALLRGGQLVRKDGQIIYNRG